LTSQPVQAVFLRSGHRL